MYAAVSGLKTHMSALNVIGNNISNVNTQAYKATRYTFSEALYTTSRSGSNGTDQLGGRNPAQIGYGCSIGTIDLDMSTKTFTPTGIQMDCMIDGDGFFLVGDKTKATGVKTQSELEGMMLTRLGNFEEKGGYIVDGDGQVLYGFLAVKNPNYQSNAADLPAGTNVEDEWIPSTTLAALRLPQCVNYLKTITAENDEGETAEGEEAEVKTVSRTKVLFPTQQANGDVFDGTVGDLTEADRTEMGVGEDTALKAEQVSLSNMAIDETGRITGTTQDDQTIVIGYVAIGKVDSPNGVTHVDGRYYQALGGAGKLHLTSVGGTVVYKAPVANPDDAAGGGADGEEAAGGSEIDVISAGDTTIINGGLEGSGTDLATEISNMIMIQRGYQANTRIVTVTDSMLEELVNMKR